MKFGLRLLPMTGSLRELVHLAVLAEDAGFDQVWLPHDPFMEHPQTLAAAIVEHTKRVGIGAMVSPYSVDPGELATSAATLDLLSEGRALICVGFHSTDMCAWTGDDPSEASARLRSTIELTRALLRGDVASSSGPVFHWTDDCYLRFKPLRESIPIYVAAFGDDLLRMSGELGDGTLPAFYPPQIAREMVPLIKQGAQSAGREPAELDIGGCVWISISATAQAAAESLRPMVSYFGPYLSDHALAMIGLSHRDFAKIESLVGENRRDEAAAEVTDDMLRLSIVGTPVDVIEQIEELAALGVTQINVGGPLGPDPAEAIALLGKHVIPHFAG